MLLINAGVELHLLKNINATQNFIAVLAATDEGIFGKGGC